uniref:CSON008793 protein n=1 Tax=Culicoides sonorensis TaxID=179676 RepID=A0A336MXN2_CULSO
MEVYKRRLIWKQDSIDDSMSSMQSIDSEFGESRFSESSIASDLPRHRKKKRSLMSKLRSKLSNSRGSDSEMSRHGSDSDLSLGGDIASSSNKKDLSKRISGMFKRAGSSSRGNSVEKTLPPIGNNGNGISRPMSVPASGSATQLNEKHLSKSAKPPLSSSQTQLRKRVSK